MLAGGAALTAAGTAAFSDVSGSREAQVDITDDATAYLSIENALDPSQPPLFGNLTDANMEITLSSSDDIQFDVNGDGNFSEPVTFSIASGNDEDVELTGSDDTAIVDIFVNLTKNGENVGSIELSREFDIPQAGAITDIEPTVTNVGKSGKYSFELENTSGINITLDGVAVLFDTAEECPGENEAVQVGGENQDDIFTDETGQIVDSTIDDSNINDFTRGVTLEASGGDDTEEFEFDRFRDGTGGGNTGVAVKNVDIVIRATDGSTTTIELRGQEGGGC